MFEKDSCDVQCTNLELFFTQTSTYVFSALMLLVWQRKDYLACKTSCSLHNSQKYTFGHPAEPEDNQEKMANYPKNQKWQHLSHLIWYQLVQTVLD